MQERSTSPDSAARKPRKRTTTSKRAKVTPELLAQYTNPDDTGLTVSKAPAFTKLPPVREISPADTVRTTIAADPTLHNQWLTPALYAQNLPRHLHQRIAQSWRNAKPETFGGTPGSKFETGADPSPLEAGTWIFKVKYTPATTTTDEVD